MTVQKYLLGVDIGSSNIKVIVFSLTGEVIGSSSEELIELYPADGHVEQEPELVWSKFCSAVKAAVKNSGLTSESIAGMGIDSNRCGFLLLDKNYKPLTNIMTWRDTRSMQQVKEFDQCYPDVDVYHITGEEGLPQHTLFKIMWCKEKWPEIWEKGKHILLSHKDYILLKIFGRPITSKSIAQSTGLFDINTLEYSSTILDKIQITENMLPQLYDSNAVVGELSAAMAEKLGLHAGLPIICGLCDATASQVGSGSVRKGLFTVSIGTCGAVRTFSPLPKYDDSKFNQIRVFSPYGYVPTCTISDAGSVLRWFRDNFSGAERQEAEEKGIDVYRLLDDRADEISSGSEGLLTLPNFTGASYALKNENVFGAFIGIRNYHTHAHFVRAIMEGVTMSLKSVIESFRKSGYEVSGVTLGGGGAKSKLWIQIIADVMNLPVHVPACEESSCLGSAIMAALGLGLFENLEEAVGSMVKIDWICYPIKKNVKDYEALYDLFCELNMTLTDYYGIHSKLSSPLIRSI